MRTAAQRRLDNHVVHKAKRLATEVAREAEDEVDDVRYLLGHERRRKRQLVLLACRRLHNAHAVDERARVAAHARKVNLDNDARDATGLRRRAAHAHTLPLSGQ